MSTSHRRFVRRIACWALLITATCLVAADAVKRVPRVTVTKLDKTAVLGEFVEASPAGVTIKPSPKVDAKLIPWSEIKTVSNGLTRQKVVDEWKIAKAEQLCDTCHGGGTTACETCKGTGVDAAAAKPCEKCNGTGDLGKCPKCTDGKVPCPATCLKAAMFTGLPTNADGKKHKTFRNKDGSVQWWSEGHIGELIVQENGAWVDKGKCPTCGGTSLAVCPTCHGTAKKACPTCHGAGVLGAACAVCKGGQVDCKTCAGTGLKSGAVTPPAAGNP